MRDVPDHTTAVDQFVARIRAEREAKGLPVKCQDPAVYRVLDGIMANRTPA
jgi:hypothetical protein